MSFGVHPSAFIAPSATVRENVTIGPCVVIGEQVTIGEGTRIDAFASVHSFTRIGRNNHIHSYASVGGDPQDLKFHGEESWLEIGDNNVIREFATLGRGTEGGGGVTKVGNNCLLMAYTHVAHDCLLGNNIILSNGVNLAGHVELQDYVIVGGLSAIHQFSRVGAHAFVGGMTGIPQDVPPFMLSAGARGSIHGPNLVGLRRMNAGKEDISLLKQAYKTIWLSGIPRKEALEALEMEHGANSYIKTFIAFIRESQRGIVSTTPSKEQDS